MDVKKSLRTESGTQLFERLNSRPSLTNIEPKLFSSVSPRDVIQISGEAGSGKTELLYHFIVRCIFPDSWKEIQLGGLDTGVIFVDNDYHFNLFRLINIFEKRIYHLTTLNGKSEVTNSEISEFITERLRLLRIIKCASTEQFIVTLHSLENMLASNREISCIMVDSISAFYWMDRMNVMQQNQKFDEQYSKLIVLLKKVMSDYSLTTFVTKQNLTKKSEKANSGEEYDFMGRRWQKFVTHNIELSYQRHEEGRTFLRFSLTLENNKTSGTCIVTDAGMEL